MAEEEESFENLDDLDWSDVESELKANRDQILSEVKSDGGGEQKEGQEVDCFRRKTVMKLDRRNRLLLPEISISIFCLMYSFQS